MTQKYTEISSYYYYSWLTATVEPPLSSQKSDHNLDKIVNVHMTVLIFSAYDCVNPTTRQKCPYNRK